MAEQLYAQVTGCSDFLSVNVSDSHASATATATIRCLSSSLDVGDSVTVRLGYTGNHDRVFSGYVKAVQRSQSPTVYEISCANAMIRAVDFFIASTNPNAPYSKTRITAQQLIRELMAMAGLTNYSGGNSGFTFATKGVPLEVNLTSVYDFCKFIADTLAWHIYADNDGKVHFLSRPPFPDSDPSVASLTGDDMLSVSHLRSDRDLRNRVVVYGREGVYADASASSPYLPGGFFKTVVIAAPTVIDTQSMAQQTANYNLAKLNRLTIGGSVVCIGNPSISARSCVNVSRSAIGMSGQYYVFACEHEWGRDGYTTILELRQ